MTEAGSYKWIEVLLLLLAGGGFVWWQLADLRREKAASQARRQAQNAQQADTQANTQALAPGGSSSNPPEKASSP
jgi:hypothetical protein